MAITVNELIKRGKDEGISEGLISNFLKSDIATLARRRPEPQPQPQSGLTPAPLANAPSDIEFASANEILKGANTVTQGFGNRNPSLYGSGIHRGVDFRAGVGVPLV